MDSGKQQIVYYFIEEAKEHLDTLERGLLDLGAVMEDQERVNEMFRAAHSVKGGAAMLGFDSIKNTAHRLEDCFKILKENPVSVDRKVESMFLKGYDTLKDLVERLQGPFGLQEDEADKAVQAAQPNFAQLQAYLNQLVNNGGKAGASGSPVNITAQATDTLKEMLQLFKQSETPQSRQELEGLCDRFGQLGAEVQTWQTMLKTVRQAISNPKNSYRTLAPVAIKELKQASDLLAAGKGDAIAPSPTLLQLGAVPKAAPPAATPAPKPAQEGITIPLEPKAAAKVLLQSFDKKQLSELVVILHKAIRS